MSIISDCSVRERLNSTLQRYIPSSCFSTPSILSTDGITEALKYALELISAAGKCLAEFKAPFLASRLYSGLPDLSLFHKIKDTSSSPVVKFTSQGSSARPPEITVYVGYPGKIWDY